MRAILVLALLASGGALALDVVSASNAWTRAMPPGSTTTAVYLRLSNTGDRALHLLDGRTEIAGKVEVHEHQHRDGMMRMRRVENFQVPAGSAVEFKPGGYHLMMFGLSQVPAAGQTFILQLRFEDEMTLDIPVTVRGAGEQ